MLIEEEEDNDGRRKSRQWAGKKEKVEREDKLTHTHTLTVETDEATNRQFLKTICETKASGKSGQKTTAREEKIIKQSRVAKLGRLFSDKKELLNQKDTEA